MILLAHNEDLDQSERMYKLIWAFAVYIWAETYFRKAWHIFKHVRHCQSLYS